MCTQPNTGGKEPPGRRQKNNKPSQQARQQTGQQGDTGPLLSKPQDKRSAAWGPLKARVGNASYREPDHKHQPVQGLQRHCTKSTRRVSPGGILPKQPKHQHARAHAHAHAPTHASSSRRSGPSCPPNKQLTRRQVDTPSPQPARLHLHRRPLGSTSKHHFMRYGHWGLGNERLLAAPCSGADGTTLQ